MAVEMTGTYHRPVQRAFRKAGSETRLVHPFASRHYRLPAHADSKTDDHDLEGIFRAAVNGFGLLEPEWDETLSAFAIAGPASPRSGREAGQAAMPDPPGAGTLPAGLRGAVSRGRPVDAAGGHGRGPPRRLGPRRSAARGIPGVLRWLREDKLRAQSRTVERLCGLGGQRRRRRSALRRT